MSKQKVTLPAVALILASTLWGVNTVLIKIGVSTIPVPIFMSIRFLVASLILLPFAIRDWKPLTKKQWSLLLLSSIIYNSIGALALNAGLSKTTATNAAIISLLYPIILMLLSVEFLKERFNPKTFFGILVALAGSLIIIGRVWDSGSTGELTGNLLVLCSVFASVIGTILFKPLIKKTGTYQATFSSLFFGIIPIAIIASTQMSDWKMSATSSRSWSALIFSTVFIVVANSLFFYALRRKQVQSTGVYQYLQPVATIITAWFLISERLSLMFVIGAGLVFAGIYLAEFTKLRRTHTAFLGRRMQ